METERDFKAKALGVVGKEEKLKADFSHKVSVKKIQETLANERVGLVMFCRGCGSYHGVKKEFVAAAEEVLERDISRTEEYIEVFACVLCDSNNEDSDFKKIADIEE